MEYRRIIKTLIGICYFPHEAAHYITIWYWSESLNLEVVQRRVHGRLKEDIPENVIRLDAIAPMIIFGVIWTQLPLQTIFLRLDLIRFPIIIVYAFWMIPSRGDWQIALDAEEIKERGVLPENPSISRSAKKLFMIGILISFGVLFLPILPKILFNY